MERSFDQIAAKRAKLPDAGAGEQSEDRLSALHDDLLLRILPGLDTTAEAARTSLLARRWKGLWRGVQEVRFNLATDGDLIRDVLDLAVGAAPDADAGANAGAAVPDLHGVYITTKDAGADSIAAWLPAAAGRLVGELIYRNVIPKESASTSTAAAADDDEDEEEDGEASEIGLVQLPCFERATKIQLKLGYQELAFPAQGVFSKLTNLAVGRVRFYSTCNLGDAVSEARSPCLQKLSVFSSHGLDGLTIRSKSLLKIKLFDLGGTLQQLTIVAPNLLKLRLVYCLLDHEGRKPVAHISAPQIVSLLWADAYDPESVYLGRLEQLQHLNTKLFWVYGPLLQREQDQCLRFLKRFKAVHTLHLLLGNQPELLMYPQEVHAHDYQYLSGDKAVLPQIVFLHLDLFNDKHAFGASVFYMLRICSGLRRLFLVFLTMDDLEEETACPSDCICDEQENWKTEELLLNHLQEIEITGLKGSQYEVRFVNQVFIWAKALKQLKIVFSPSVSESMAKELYKVFRSFSRPEICMECAWTTVK